jgi:RNA polymerase sigma-70 factor (ECF subfamily)
VTDDDLALAFEAERPRLLRLAYTATGSWADAEDCVQESWLRLRRVDARAIENLQAWLTTTVGRIALDALGSARVRREQYVGTWLPEPVVELGPSPVAGTDRTAGDPADRVTLDESVSMALLVVLERLSPAQRVAFVLHDVFGLGFDDVAEVVGRTPAAVRQLASRARRDVEAGTPRFDPSADEQRAVVEAFLAAAREGDLPALTALLDPDVVLTGDGGGKAPALREPVHGAATIAKVLLGWRSPRSVVPASVNGAPGLVVRDGAGVLSVVSFTVVGGRIAEIDVFRNPDKLGSLAAHA